MWRDVKRARLHGPCHEWNLSPISQNHTNLSRKQERLSVAKGVPANHMAQVGWYMAAFRIPHMSRVSGDPEEFSVEVVGILEDTRVQQKDPEHAD